MPNRPDDPYGRPPRTAVVGAALMVLGGVALLFLSATWHDWRQAAIGALLLFALIMLAAAPSRLKRKRRHKTLKQPKTNPRAEPVAAMAPEPFDPASFIDAAKRRQSLLGVRQIEGQQRSGEPKTATRHRQVGGAETIRRLQDLRDHPGTPETERQAAGEKVKKLRSKRRSAWSKR